MGFASQIYFLICFGQEMERADGPAQHAVFVLLQVLLLVGWGSAVGYPSFARSLIAASVYCCSRREPSRPMEVQFGVKIEYWLLPYVNLVVDCLQAQSPAAAVPHLVGILNGHVYHFFSAVWPKMGGRRWLAPPRGLKAAFIKPKAAKALAAKKESAPAAKAAEVVKAAKKVKVAPAMKQAAAGKSARKRKKGKKGKSHLS